MTKVKYLLTIKNKFREDSQLQISLDELKPITSINDRLMVKYFPNENLVRFYLVYTDNEHLEDTLLSKEDNINNSSFTHIIVIGDDLYKIERM